MTPFLTIEQKAQCLTDAVGEVKREIQRFLAAANVAFLTGFMEARSIIDCFIGMILRQEAIEGDRDLLNNIEILGGKEGKFPARRRKDPAGQIPPPILPAPIYSSLHNLRIYGNLVVHRFDVKTMDVKNVRLTSTDLQVALGQIIRLIEWYFQEYARGPHLDPLYDQLPEPVLGRFAEAPPDTAGFIGRAGDVEELQRSLTEGPAKLITVLAPAGMGKTLLTARAALGAASRWQAGSGQLLWFDLKSAPSFGEVSARILASLQPEAKPTDLAIVQLSPSARIGQIVRAMAEREVLLVLDNFESWLDPKTRNPVDHNIGQLLEQCATRAHRSCLVMTSRAAVELTGIPQTHVLTHRVRALPVNEAKEVLLRQGVSGTDRTLGEVCATLGGNPRLLIMLAEVLLKRNCRDLDEGIRRFPTLVATQSDGLLAGVWEELSCSAQLILKIMSILNSPAPYSDVAAIALGLDACASDTEDVIWNELVPRALLVSSHDGNAFAFEHQLIRDYSLRQWSDIRIPQKAALAHYERMRKLSHDRDEATRAGLAIIRHAVALKDFSLAATTLTDSPFKQAMMRQGRYLELLELCQPLLMATKHLDLLTRIRTRRLAANCHGDLGEYPAACRLLESCRHELEPCADLHEVCSTLIGLCGVLRKMQQFDSAEAAGQQALVIAKEHGLVEEEARACLELGSSHRNRGRLDQAATFAAEGFQAAERCGKPRVRVLARINTGRLLKCKEELDSAKRMFREALDLSREMGHVALQAQLLENLADVARKQGHIDEAMQYVNQAIDMFQRIGDRTGEGIARHCRGLCLHAMGANHAAEAVAELRRGLAIAVALEHVREIAAVLLSIGFVFAEPTTSKQAIACVQTAQSLFPAWVKSGQILNQIRSVVIAAGTNWQDLLGEVDERRLALLEQVTGIDVAAWERIRGSKQSVVEFADSEGWEIAAVTGSEATDTLISD